MFEALFGTTILIFVIVGFNFAMLMVGFSLGFLISERNEGVCTLLGCISVALWNSILVGSGLWNGAIELFRDLWHI